MTRIQGPSLWEYLKENPKGIGEREYRKFSLNVISFYRESERDSYVLTQPEGLIYRDYERIFAK